MIKEVVKRYEELALLTIKCYFFFSAFFPYLLAIVVKAQTDKYGIQNRTYTTIKKKK